MYFDLLIIIFFVFITVYGFISTYHCFTIAGFYLVKENKCDWIECIKAGLNWPIIYLNKTSYNNFSSLRQETIDFVFKNNKNEEK